MSQKLISRAEFARRAGISAAASTKACNGALSAACEGKRIDLNHPLVVKYLTKKDLDQTTPAAAGLDPIYEEAVRFCQASGRYSATGVQKEFRIGWERAKKIVDTMRAGGLIPGPGDMSPHIPAEEPKKEPHVRGTKAARETKKNRPPPEPLDPDEMLLQIPEDIRAFADMSLRELVGRFGTDTAFLDWLKATKAIEDINEKRLKNAQTEGTLVSRELMRTGVIDTFNSAHIKLMSDGAKTITRRIVAMHDAGRSLEDCEKFVIDQISSFIKPAKAKIKRVMKNA